MAEDKSSSIRDKVDHKSDHPREFPHEQIKHITNNFDKALILGIGGFGTVYKGIFENGEEIAVKVLKDTLKIDSKDFQKEFENLRKFKHRNIVELVGFCNESEKVDAEYEGKPVIAEEIHRALCFEYVPNGSLTRHISADECSGHNWHIRYKIIKGICDGLEYLRQGPEFLLWHLDLKPDNILLNSNMIPKIADFGLSRLLHDESTRKTANFQGSLGYMPPEYIELGIITKEFDIYSLGVIIAKIMAGEKAYNKFAEMPGETFIKHVRHSWRKRLCKTLPTRPLQVYCEQVTKCIQIAVQCMKRDRKQRPNIQLIVSDLRETELKICNLGSQTEQFWEEESTLLEESIKDRPPEMAVGASRGKVNKGMLNTLPEELPLDFLKTITGQFSDEQIISHGAFGKSYKGILPDGKVIMVKKLSENAPVARDKVFATEVQNILALQNENVIQLLGYCHEGHRKVVENTGKYIVADIVESLLCYEYLPEGSLQKNLFEVPSKMDWGTRFKVIKGICQGLLSLHSSSIVHMDLKPENILLDNNMRPKIVEFGLSRLFGQEQTRMKTQNVVGSLGYIALEYLYRGEVSTKLDIYSLGLLILETTTGERHIPKQNDPSGWEFFENVQEKWTLERIASEYSFLDSEELRQVTTCIEIGLQCMNIDRYKRPSIGQILDMLDELPQGSDSLISLQPQRINFPFKPKRLTSSSLYLINRTDDRIAFRIVTQIPKKYRTKLPFCGIVLPKCTYTLNVITPEQRKAPPSDNDDSLTLQSSKALHDHEDLDNVDPVSVAVFLDTAGDEVQETKVVVACESLTETVSNQIIDGPNYREVLSVDVHPTETWILTSNKRGYVCIWNYQTQAEVESTEVSREPVYSVKFIEQKNWFVVGSGDGSIYVFDYNTMEEVHVIEEAHDGHAIMCLVVNPTSSFALSGSDDHTIKLWDWTNGWQCIRTFEGHDDKVIQVMFDPMNSESFTSVSLDRTVKIWNIHSATCNITLDGHPDGLLFVRCQRQFLVSGSSDGATKVWNLETDSYVDTLQDHGIDISALCWHKELWVLVTGSLDGTVRIWKWKFTSRTYRLENIIALNLGAVHALGYLNELTRIVVGCDEGIALMEINVL